MSDRWVDADEVMGEWFLLPPDEEVRATALSIMSRCQVPHEALLAMKCIRVIADWGDYLVDPKSGLIVYEHSGRTWELNFQVSAGPKHYDRVRYDILLTTGVFGINGEADSNGHIERQGWDKKRDTRTKKLGYGVLRFWWTQSRDAEAILSFLMSHARETPITWITEEWDKRIP